MTPSDGQLQNAAELDLLGTEYTHIHTPDGGDLYLTRYGRPFAEQLLPVNWHEKSWFEQNREKLVGTSTVYKVRTRAINGVSKDLVVKWCRVGETVPLDTFTLHKFVEAEFNSPYEEFSLVMEMRERPGPGTIRTHKPLAIYVPAKRYKLWQTGRSETRIERKKAKFRDVELDIYRQYILIYEWVKGVSCVDAFMEIFPDMESRRNAISELTERVEEEMAAKGFRVLDTKPEHFIVRPEPDGTLLKDRGGKTAYALVDFELLQRTAEREREVAAVRRADYLKHQKNRFTPSPDAVYPENLQPASIFGVDYVYGQTESTQGCLWVVGHDPQLFDYFLPERWRRTTRTKLSETNETFYTKTKDNVHLVWKVSRVGEQIDADDASPAMAAHGYNSPFEEVAMAINLASNGVPPIYPRAIYMTGQEAVPTDYHFDGSRYQSHEAILSPIGKKVLRPDHNYIIVWGYWNGLDELLASCDAQYCRGINLDEALRTGVIDKVAHDEQLYRGRMMLEDAGFEDLNPKGTHMMLSITPSDQLIYDQTDQLALRICNFSLIRKR